jgi:hypothetical protein
VKAEAKARAKAVELSYVAGNGAAALVTSVTTAVALLPREVKEEESGELREGASADGLKKAGRGSVGLASLPPVRRRWRAASTQRAGATAVGRARGGEADARRERAGLLEWAEREAGGLVRK